MSPSAVTCTSCRHSVLRKLELKVCAQLSRREPRSHAGQWFPPRLSSQSKDSLCFNPPCRKAAVRRRCPRGALHSRLGQENPRCVLLPAMRSPCGFAGKVKSCSLSCQALGRLAVYKMICPRVLHTGEPCSHRIVLSRAPFFGSGLLPTSISPGGQRRGSGEPRLQLVIVPTGVG